MRCRWMVAVVLCAVISAFLHATVHTLFMFRRFDQCLRVFRPFALIELIAKFRVVYYSGFV